MPTNVKVDDLKINKLTKAQYEAAVQGGTISEYELSVLTDDDTYATSEQLTQGLAAKQDTISDLATIRSGAAAGATAVQPNDLATVATTGAYSDLSGTPTIPTVNNATLTITQGGTTKGIFTANADTDVTIDIDAGGSSLPSQSGNAGKFLVTDGTNVSWSNEIKNQDIKIYKTGAFGSGAIIFGYSSSSSATAPNNPIYITEQPISWNGMSHPVLTLNSQSAGKAGLSANRIIPQSNDAEIGISGSEWTVWKKIYVTKINNGGASSSDITVPATSGTMVVADPTGATQGQVLTLDANLNAVWETPSGGSSLPDMTGQSGKFLTTDGSAASWSDKPLVNNHTGTMALSICGTNTASTGNRTVAVGFDSSAYYSGTAIGYRALSSGIQCIAIGYTSSCGGDRSIAIGYNSQVTAQEAYQLGYGVNSERGTFYVGMSPDNGATWQNHKLLDKDGTIPEARLADTTNATAGQVLTLDSNLVATWATPSGGGAGAPTLTWYTVSTAGNTLTIADTSSAQLVKVYKNGLLLQPTEDYSISGTTLTTVTAMVVGDKITTEAF